MNIQLSSPKIPLKLSGWKQHFTFNLIIRIKTVTNCGEEAGSRIECFCQCWGNLMLSLRQLKVYSKNPSWCWAQVSCPIYLTWTLFLQHCSMFSWHVREVSFTRPQAAHLSSKAKNILLAKPNQIPFMKFPPLVHFQALIERDKFSIHIQVLLHSTVFQLFTHSIVIHLLLLILLLHSLSWIST